MRYIRKTTYNKGNLVWQANMDKRCAKKEILNKLSIYFHATCSWVTSKNKIIVKCQMCPIYKGGAK